MYDTQDAIAALYATIQKSTEDKVEATINMSEYHSFRVNTLREVFAKEARAQSALTRAMLAVEQYVNK